MVKYLVYKKWRPSEARIFKNERLANAFIRRVRSAGGAKLVKVKLKTNKVRKRKRR